MNIRTLKASLRQHPDQPVRFVLPGGETIPAEYHITEVGQVTKRFIDCGGTIRAEESCLLQAWVSANDPEHRLAAGKLAGILDQARAVLASEELDVEIEYGSEVVAQYTVESLAVAGNEVHVRLGNKHTDCLAREQCGVGDEGEDEAAGCGCAATASRCC